MFAASSGNSVASHGRDDRLIKALEVQQHLQPHSSIRQALDKIRQQIGLCDEAAASALQWLHLDENRKIGRLRRSELMQLAHSLHRFWRQTAQPSVS